MTCVIIIIYVNYTYRKYLHIYCFLGNVALGKTASQTGMWSDLVASRAVDGVADFTEAHCSHPLGSSTPYVWWQVDLGDVYVINSVTIVNGWQTGGKLF